MKCAVVLFTSDLRLHDHPPLRAALSACEQVVPVFVLDDGIRAAGFQAPHRQAFLADCLTDLDEQLRARGGRLVVRSGDVVDEVGAVAHEADADEVHMAGGVSSYAHAREERLRAALDEQGRRLYVHDAVVTALAPGAVVPSGSDHYAVFTPYYRRWSQEEIRGTLAAPRSVRVPDAVRSQKIPSRKDVAGVGEGLADGGESEARKQLARWLRSGLGRYEQMRDDLAADATSKLSAHLHFGTLSAAEVVHRARSAGGPGADAYVRQLCWRDFHHQVLAARPRAAADDYRDRHDLWRTGSEAEDDIEAWKNGRTGYPVVDAAMRQLRHEGWMHNRGRLLAASFLAKTLYVDWRTGARHFLDLLVDGDLANNQLNWQWVAGTGTDTRPNRVLDPVRQGRLHDPDGTYVRRWVPELEDLRGTAVHEPWKLRRHDRTRGGYPEPLVALAEGHRRFERGRGID
ncbi:DNA photolyase family protein [Streptomyces sp. NBC_00390]|uniref:cryptochrome/photolyase family protein n=1 Tax=Streptomyces sp. NBC_00390 TaxID=2975736 RepID=UPI002E1A1DBE